MKNGVNQVLQKTTYRKILNEPRASMPLPKLKKMALKPIDSINENNTSIIEGVNEVHAMSHSERTRRTIAELYRELKEKGHLVKLSEE